MTTNRSAASRSASARSRAAYSSAERGSWIEQGPMTTSSRSSPPTRIRWMACRAANTAAAISSEAGSSRRSWSGGETSLISRMRTSSIGFITLEMLRLRLLRSFRPPESSQIAQGVSERLVLRVGLLEPGAGALLRLGAIGMARQAPFADLDRAQQPYPVAQIEDRRLHLGSLLAVGAGEVLLRPRGRRVPRIAQPRARAADLDTRGRTHALAAGSVRVRVAFAESSFRIAGGGANGRLGAAERAVQRWGRLRGSELRNPRPGEEHGKSCEIRSQTKPPDQFIRRPLVARICAVGTEIRASRSAPGPRECRRRGMACRPPRPPAPPAPRRGAVSGPRTPVRAPRWPQEDTSRAGTPRRAVAGDRGSPRPRRHGPRGRRRALRGAARRRRRACPRRSRRRDPPWSSRGRLPGPREASREASDRARGARCR